ncbi:hypothetical protein J6590_095948 [Homalodisca vitripennis]|nr:hypothetical protein J6590_095948 [Homalodisca vitripennis]
MCFGITSEEVFQCNGIMATSYAMANTNPVNPISRENLYVLGQLLHGHGHATSTQRSMTPLPPPSPRLRRSITFLPPPPSHPRRSMTPLPPPPNHPRRSMTPLSTEVNDLQEEYEDRKSEWEQIARDRDRFRKRTAKFEEVFKSTLKKPSAT